MPGVEPRTCCALLTGDRDARCGRLATHHATVEFGSFRVELHAAFDVCAAHAAGRLPALWSRVVEAAPHRVAVEARPWAPHWLDVRFVGRTLGAVCDRAATGEWPDRAPGGDRWQAGALDLSLTRGDRTVIVGRYAGQDAAVAAVLALYPGVVDHLNQHTNTTATPCSRDRNRIG